MERYRRPAWVKNTTIKMLIIPTNGSMSCPVIRTPHRADPHSPSVPFLMPGCRSWKICETDNLELRWASVLGKMFENKWHRVRQAQVHRTRRCSSTLARPRRCCFRPVQGRQQPLLVQFCRRRQKHLDGNITLKLLLHNSSERSTHLKKVALHVKW